MYPFWHYSVVKNNTFLDKLAKKMITDEPITGKYKSIKLGIDHGTDYDLNVYDDIVIETHFPKNLIKKLDETFGKVKSFEDFNFFKAFNELYVKEYSIKIIIYKDKEIANKTKEEVISRYFKK